MDNKSKAVMAVTVLILLAIIAGCLILTEKAP
jgi:hypothetical protein